MVRRELGSNRLAIIVLSSLAMFITSCYETDFERNHRSFFKLSTRQQKEYLSELSVEDQIELHIATMRRIHPPRLGPAEVVAENGSVVVPILLERLERANSPVTKVEIIFVFNVMQLISSYCVSSDEETMAILLEEASKMTDSPLHERVREMLSWIETSECANEGRAR